MKFFSKNKLNAAAGFEFLIVSIMIFVFFMVFIDLALYFRQYYLVQAANDEIFVRLDYLASCDNPNNMKNVAAATLNLYYSANFEFDMVCEGDSLNRSCSLSDDRMIVNFVCNKNKLDTVTSEYLYNGIFMFKGSYISSSPSSSVSYY